MFGTFGVVCRGSKMKGTSLVIHILFAYATTRKVPKTWHIQCWVDIYVPAFTMFQLIKQDFTGIRNQHLINSSLTAFFILSNFSFVNVLRLSHTYYFKTWWIILYCASIILLWSSGKSFWLQRGPGFDSRPYQIFWEVGGLERGPLSLVRTIEELLEW
jgi:hypothetical protein